MSYEYTNVARLRTLLPILGSVTTIASADMALYVNDAEALVNGKLAKLYTTPVNSAPMLSMIASDIAIYRLLALRVFTQDQVNKSEWIDRYKESMELLDEIANGDIPLVVGDEVVETDSSRVRMESNTQGYVQTFQEDNVLESEIDDDKLTDIAGDRQ